MQVKIKHKTEKLVKEGLFAKLFKRDYEIKPNVHKIKSGEQ